LFVEMSEVIYPCCRLELCPFILGRSDQVCCRWEYFL